MSLGHVGVYIGDTWKIRLNDCGGDADSSQIPLGSLVIIIVIIFTMGQWSIPPLRHIFNLYRTA